MEAHRARIWRNWDDNRYATALDLHVLPIIGEMYMDAIEHADIVPAD